MIRFLLAHLCELFLYVKPSWRLVKGLNFRDGEAVTVILTTVNTSRAATCAPAVKALSLFLIYFLICILLHHQRFTFFFPFSSTSVVHYRFRLLLVIFWIWHNTFRSDVHDSRNYKLLLFLSLRMFVSTSGTFYTLS